MAWNNLTVLILSFFIIYIVSSAPSQEIEHKEAVTSSNDIRTVQDVQEGNISIVDNVSKTIDEDHIAGKNEMKFHKRPEKPVMDENNESITNQMTDGGASVQDVKTTDEKSVLEALDNRKLHELRMLLYEICTLRRIVLQWVPSHYGITGNKKADRLAKEGARSNVMTLSDDVITDALFTNIDTLQDHLELCEEGLRQQMKVRSNGKLLQDFNTEHDPGATSKSRVQPGNKDSNGRSELKNKSDDDDKDNDEDYEDDDEKDKNGKGDGKNEEKDDDNEDDEEINEHTSPSTRIEESHRNRRSVSTAKDEEESLGKVDVLVQKVVSRLSERLGYLRSSLVQCHLLYKQFELM